MNTTTEKGELHNFAHQMLWRPLQALKKSQKLGGSSTPLCVESKIGSSGGCWFNLEGSVAMNSADKKGSTLRIRAL